MFLFSFCTCCCKLILMHVNTHSPQFLRIRGQCFGGHRGECFKLGRELLQTKSLRHQNSWWIKAEEGDQISSQTHDSKYPVEQRTHWKTFFDPSCWREMECVQNSWFYIYHCIKLTKQYLIFSWFLMQLQFCFRPQYKTACILYTNVKHRATVTQTPQGCLKTQLLFLWWGGEGEGWWPFPHTACCVLSTAGCGSQALAGWLMTEDRSCWGGQQSSKSRLQPGAGVMDTQPPFQGEKVLVDTNQKVLMIFENQITSIKDEK